MELKKVKLKKMKTKLKIDDAYFFAPYLPIYGVVEVEKMRQFLEDSRRHEIFEYVED